VWATYENFSGAISREISHSVCGKGAGALGVVILKMNDAAAMRRPACGIEIKPHRLQDVDDGLREMRGPQHIAAEIQQEILWLRCLRRPVDELPLARHKLQISQYIDFAEVFCERKSWHDQSSGL